MYLMPGISIQNPAAPIQRLFPIPPPIRGASAPFSVQPQNSNQPNAALSILPTSPPIQRSDLKSQTPLQQIPKQMVLGVQEQQLSRKVIPGPSTLAQTKHPQQFLQQANSTAAPPKQQSYTVSDKGSTLNQAQDALSEAQIGVPLAAWAASASTHSSSLPSGTSGSGGAQQQSAYGNVAAAAAAAAAALASRQGQPKARDTKFTRVIIHPSGATSSSFQASAARPQKIIFQQPSTQTTMQQKYPTAQVKAGPTQQSDHNLQQPSALPESVTQPPPASPPSTSNDVDGDDGSGNHNDSEL